MATSNRFGTLDEIEAVGLRPQAAASVARWLGAEDLVVFLRNEDSWVPAGGFPAELEAAAVWQDLVARSAEGRSASAELPFPGSRGMTRVHGQALGPDAVLVLVGGSPRAERIDEASGRLRLLARALSAERRAEAHQDRAAHAQAAARETQVLAGALAQAESELNASVRELTERLRLKDEFLATLSHELRSPLNAIVGWAHMLREGRLDAPTAAKALETIDRNAGIQKQLISDILDLSRIIAGKLRLEASLIDPADVVEAALESHRPAALARGVTLAFQREPAVASIVGDVNRLQQVVSNLLSNAVKFARSRVTVRVLSHAEHVEIAVEDDGRGIEPSFLPYVFERFRQGDPGAARPHGGLGLGLTIVRHLVELHGGRVEASNQGNGGGATFRVKLPVTLTSLFDMPPAPPRERPWLENAPSLQGLCVLAVDDEPDTRDLLSMVLGRCGARVLTAACAADALSLLTQERPDVLVADIEMPGEDGHSLLRRVRLLAPDQGGSIPAAALTAYAAAQDRMKALRSGFQVHIPKPVQPAELAIVVASLVGRAPRSS